MGKKGWTWLRKMIFQPSRDMASSRRAHLSLRRMRFSTQVRPEHAADAEGDGGAEHVAAKHEERTPPKAEEEPAAERQHAAGKQQQVARGDQERIEERAPPLHLAHALLHPAEHLDQVEIMREKDRDADDQEKPGQLQSDRSGKFGHSGREGNC